MNGQSISHADLDNKLESSPAARGVLQNMVMSTLIDQYAKQHNINVSSAEISKVEDQYKAQYPGDQWNELLKARSLTEQDVQDLIRRQLIIDKAVGGNIQISEKQIKDYFDKNHAQFDKPAEARARHILVPDLKTAEKVEADLKSGKDFAAEAKQYSTDPGSRDKGGELGFFRKGAMVPSFDAYAFSAPIGKISQPIKSAFGYHIIQVEERKPAQKATLASTHDQIAQMLRQQQESPLLQPFYQQLQSNAKIQINDPRFEGLFPTPPPTSTAPAPAAPAPQPTK
ncbi:MAG TPA: peptidylprolyl isomerase [Candidatus Baltobacteraceae bacterium]|nr:peptidylprolyl isomerase [Candidatus Baltobacteraceae bacterium]